MGDLITLEVAREQLPNTATCDDGTIATFISAASAVVENYCRRTFAKATYDELQTIVGYTQYLFVNNPPITQVTSVRAGQLPALYVQYNDTANQTQQASIAVNSTGVTLTKVYNNNTTTNTFTFASYPTFQLLGNAINALGTGWVATIPQQFALWQTADLIHEGAWSARNISVALLVYWYQLPFYKVNELSGEIYNPTGWLSGYQNYRVTYVGGYDPVPAAIQTATAELVKLSVLGIGMNPNMASETIDKYSYARNTAQKGLDLLTLPSKLALNQYKLMRVARYK